jgi:regulator of sigma E protease
MTALLVIAIFVVLIVVHEFGHFLVAKLTGVRVDEFGIGYPPRAFSLGVWGGTEYTLNWLPFGGFVRLYGDEETVQKGRGSFQRANRGIQAMILVAGVVMNAILAWVLFAWALHLGVPAVISEAQPDESARLFVADVVAGSPASAAGMGMGDEVLSITDDAGTAPTALDPDAIVSFVATHGGKPLSITFVHAGATTTATVRPANAVVPGDAARPALGVGLALVATRSESWPQALIHSFSVTGHYFEATFAGVWTLIAGAATFSAPIQDVVGPVGLVSIIGEAAHNGMGNVIKLAGFISVNLAIINLIPIPALDGGRLALLIVEAIIRRPAPRLAVQVINTFGVALLMLLMVVVTYHDIARLLA